MRKLSICIPTFNRSKHLKNCLNSIYLNTNKISDIEVCVSDNNSSDKTIEVIKEYKKKLNIKYNKNSSNIGIAKNILKVVEMSTSEFCWIIGDDDLLLNNAIKTVIKLIKENKLINFFFINSQHLNHSILEKYKHPIDPKLIKEKMPKFSKLTKNFESNFIDLIDPMISFDFLGGVYLSVFKKSKWMINLSKINNKNINDKLLFSNIDNTFPHTKIFAYAFKDSKAYFYSKPLTINLFGVREWTSLYPIVRSIRTSNLLDIFYKNGLPLSEYIKCKNYSLKFFIPDIIKLLLNLNKTYPYFGEIMLFYIKNFYYPNIYFSFFYQLRNLIINRFYEKKV